MNIMSVIMLVVGFVVLIGGGEALVRGAGALARSIGMSSLVVGLTVVAFATSAPELAVSTGAALSGSPGLAVGNVVGSNIANVLLVLGVSAAFAPLIVQSQVVRADIPVMVAMSMVLLLVALDGLIGLLDGMLLLAGLVAYVTTTVVLSRRRGAAVSGIAAGVADDDGGAGAADSAGSAASGDPAHDDDEHGPVRVASRGRMIGLNVLLVLVGVGLLVAGAQLLVNGATDIASALGVSDLIIGLTVVAVGTSLPEIATSVIAVVRGERDMAVGNIVGSNVFNIGGVVSVTAIIAPNGIGVEPAAVRFDIPIMLAVALVLLPVAFTGRIIARWEGMLLVGFYLAYLAYLVLETTGHDAVEPFSAAMLWFVIPITGLWLVLMAAYELGLRRGRREGGLPELHHDVPPDSLHRPPPNEDV